MPKIKSLNLSRLLAYVNEFVADVFTTDGTIILSKICNKSQLKKNTIQQHVSSLKYGNALNSKKIKKRNSTTIFEWRIQQ